MSARYYRKRPVVIQALQYTDINSLHDIAGWIREGDGSCTSPSAVEFKYEDEFRIQTLEGPMVVSPGDFVIRGIHGEHYPCKPDIFELTYEEVEWPYSSTEAESFTTTRSQKEPESG